MRHQQYHRRTHPYTVVLMYPAYSTGDHGADVYVEGAQARDGDSATRKVQRLAHQANPTIPAKDFRMVLVFDGDVSCVGDATSGWGL